MAVAAVWKAAYSMDLMLYQNFARSGEPYNPAEFEPKLIGIRKRFVYNQFFIIFCLAVTTYHA